MLSQILPRRCAQHLQKGVRRLSSRNNALKMSPSEQVKVEVNQGIIVGQQRRLQNGVVFSSFQGIPYAVPPLGHLRFKSPKPLERFEVPELDCTKEREISHQRDPFSLQVVGDENCLFLNVYTPLTERNASKRLPVMVWIHGGGFWFGNGNSDYYLPSALMQEEVVVVTLNYRLGALGFLCFPEAGVWGNAGLKDQRLALQWVHDNISQFNGDPTNVTLFGESAGAAAVHLHTYSSHAHKLFHRAIVQSGTANMEWVFQVNPSYKTRHLAQSHGCTANDPQELLHFLQSDKVSPLSILAYTLPVLTPDERRRGLPLAFRPVIEDSASPDIFFDKPILERLRERNTLAMPIIMGYNSAEGLAMLVNAVRKLPECDRDLARFVPRNIPLPTDHPEIQEVAQKMRDFYLGGRSLSPEVFNELKDLLSDYHFTVDMQNAAELQVRYQSAAPLFFYRFDYVGGRNIYKKVFQFEHLRGACHADELFYLFQMAGDENELKPDDALMVRRLCRLWANFARYGNPTPNNSDEQDVVGCTWTPVQAPSSSKEGDGFTLDYLAISKQCEMRRNPEIERIEFWRNIYRNYTPTDYSRLSAKL